MLGMIFLLFPASQSLATQTNIQLPNPELSESGISTTFIPLTLRLADPANIPTLHPLFTRVLALDGSDDYAFAPDRPSLDLGRGANRDFTIEAFFYVEADATGLVTLIQREQLFVRLLLTTGTADGIQFVIRFENGDLTLFPVLNLEPGWHHVAAFFDQEAIPGKDITGIYLDGSLEATHSDPSWGLVLDSSTSLYLGNPSANPFGGWIEEVRLSSIMRYTTPDFTVPNAYFEPDESTRALWHFDETLGSTSFADYSGKGNRLTAVNGATNIEP
jgi:hypothetical protein